MSFGRPFSRVLSQQLGMNLALMTTQAGYSRPFVNMGQFSSWYHPEGSGAVIDPATGWPQSGATKLSVTWNPDVVWPDAATIELTWTGSGTIEGSSSPYTAVISAGSTNFDATGEIENFSMKVQGDTGTFTSTFNARSQVGKGMRHMADLRTNEGQTGTGSIKEAAFDPSNPYVRIRTVSGANVFYHRTITPELIALLATTYNQPQWICLHHESTTASVTDFINRLVAAGYPSGLELLVEYSNEIWNGSYYQGNPTGFPQATYIEQAAIDSGLYTAAPGDSARRQAKYFDGADTFFELVKSIRPNNTTGVVCSQTATPNFRNNWKMYATRPGTFVDAYGISWYSGGPETRALTQAQALAQTGTTLATLIRDDWEQRVIPLIQTWKGYADADGVRLIGYEGGSHTDTNDGLDPGKSGEAHLSVLANGYEVGLVHGEKMDWLHNNVGDVWYAFEDVGPVTKPWSWQVGEMGAKTQRRIEFENRLAG